MAKRLTDSSKWQDPWFMDLPAKYKLFWLYILDNCDHAGVWKVNFKVASFYVGEHLEPSEVKRILSGRVKIIDDEYWLVEKFIEFQYGGLKNDAVGKSVQKILKKHNLVGAMEGLPRGSVGATKGLPSPYEGSKDKDKVKVKDKEELEKFSKTQIFDKWKDDELFLEEMKLLLSQCGIKNANDRQVMKIARAFLLVEFDDNKTLSDLRSHFRRWVFSKGKKLTEYL